MQLSIKTTDREAILDTLKHANLAFQASYPGDRPDRQPVHTVYGGAHLFKSDTCIKMGEIALRNLRTYAPHFAELSRALSLDGHEFLPLTEKAVTELDKRLADMSEEQRRKEKAWLSWSVYTKII